MPKFTEYFEDTQAQIVYLLLKRQHDNEDDEADMWLVERFVNGREHGYTIHAVQGYGVGESLYVSFSENRNSDQIVVYPYQHETCSEQDYKTRTIRFPAEAFSEAAEWIGLYLTGHKMFTQDAWSDAE